MLTTLHAPVPSLRLASGSSPVTSHLRPVNFAPSSLPVDLLSQRTRHLRIPHCSTALHLARSLQLIILGRVRLSVDRLYHSPVTCRRAPSSPHSPTPVSYSLPPIRRRLSAYRKPHHLPHFLSIAYGFPTLKLPPDLIGLFYKIFVFLSAATLTRLIRLLSHPRLTRPVATREKDKEEQLLGQSPAIRNSHPLRQRMRLR